jgi:hypothetical protein
MASNSISNSQSLQTARVLNATDGKERTSVGSFVILAGRILFFRHFYNVGISPLLPGRNRLRRTSRCAHGEAAGSGVWNSRAARRTQYSARIQSQNRCLAAGPFPGTGHAADAQLLGGERPHDGADANGNVSEERDHAWRRFAHFAIWSRPVECRCQKKLAKLLGANS